MNISPRENLVMAMSAVWTHRFRSGLTILGIVIGITTVVTVASLLTGLRAGVVTFFNELGPDNVFISRNSGNPGDLQEPVKERKRRPITARICGRHPPLLQHRRGRRALAVHSSRFGRHRHHRESAGI